MEWKKATGLFSWNRGGIRRRLLWIGLLFLALALLVNTLAGTLYTRSQIKKDIAQLQLEVASRISHEIEGFIENKVGRLRDFSASSSLYELGSEEQRILALLLLKNDSSFTEVSVLDDTGMEVLKVSERKVYLPSELSNMSGEVKFDKAFRDEEYVSPVYTSDKAEPYVTVAVPVKLGPNRIVGVTSAELNLKFLWQVIGDIDFSNAGYAYLVDGQGNLIAHRDPSLVLKRTDLSRVYEVQQFLQTPSGDPNPAYKGQGIIGEPVLGTFSPVGGLGWAVIVEEPVAVALAEINRLERYAFLFLSLGLSVGALIIVWVSNKITRPIHELNKGVHIIGSGNLDYQVEIESGDEIEQLAREFNQMAGELRISYATLEQKVEHRTSELSALYNVTAAANQSLELDKILQEITQKITEVFHFDATRIFLFDPQMKELHFRASFETQPELFSQVRVAALGEGIAGKAAETGEPIIFENIKSDPRYQELTHATIAKDAGYSFFAVFAIKSKLRVVGTITCIGLNPRLLTDDELQLITSMTNQIGIAVENSNLFRETAARSKELSALYDVTSTVNQSLELELVLQAVIEKIRGIFNFDTMRIYLYNAQMDELHVKASFPLDREDLPRVSVFRRGQGITGKVAETGEPIIFEDVRSDPRYRELSQTKNTQKTGHGFFAAFPIKTKLRSIGAIVCNSQMPRRLTSGEAQLITSMTDQIGVAVENSNLFRETAARSKELSALYDVTSTVNQSLELEPVLQEVIKKITEIFHFNATRVFLFDSQMEELHLQASFETDPEFNTHVRVFKRGQGNIGKVAETGEPLIFENIHNDPRYGQLSHSKATQKAGFSFLAAFPIKTGVRTVGTLICIGRTPRRLTSDEFKLITSMADQVGVAVENVNLFRETVTRAKELSALYDVTAALNQSMEPDVVLREVIHKILEVIHFDASRIYLLDREGKELRLKAYEGFDPEFTSETATDLVGIGVNGHVAGTGEPAIFEDIQTDPEYTKLAGGRLAQKAGFRAYISLPLKTKTKTLGVMNFLSCRPQRPLPNEIALLSSMANQIGIAIENSNLFDETAKRAQQLSTLNALSATVNQSLELDLILEKATEKLLDALRFDAARIFLIGREGKEWQLKAHKGISGELAQTPPYQVGEGIIGTVVQSGEMMVFDDMETDPRFRHLARTGAAIGAGFHAHVCFPLKAKEKVLGVVNLFSYGVHHFTPEELQTLGSMANQIGVAIENTSLFEAVVKRAEQLSALHSMAATVSQSLELEVVLDTSMKKVLEALKFDAARIFLLDRESNQLKIRAHKNLTERLSQAAAYRLGEGIIGKVWQSGEINVIEDMDDPEYRQLASRGSAFQAGFRSQVCFPIRVKEKVFGVGNYYSYKSHHFTPEEIQMLTSIANQIGVAVENASLFEEIKNKTTELEKTNKDLHEANRAKADFLAAMSHELRTPLNVIVGNADLVRDGVFGAINEKQGEALGKVLHQSGNLLKLINDVLALTKAEAKKMVANISTFDVNEVITQAQSYVEQLNRNGHLEILWKVEPNLPPMTTDALKLEEILHNLIGNAVKFTPEGRIEVRVRDLQRKRRIEFAVADSGIGIDERDLNKIFDQFHQLKEAHTGTYSGVGLGLNIVKTYLGLMQGDIRVESQLGIGSTFTFTLPYSI